MEGISDEDFQHAKNVWRTFNCQTLGDYHNIYLKSDVFEFSKDDSCNLQAGPSALLHTYWSFLGYAMLKLTGVKLQLVDDPDMYLMVESGN